MLYYYHACPHHQDSVDSQCETYSRYVPEKQQMNAFHGKKGGTQPQIQKVLYICVYHAFSLLGVIISLPPCSMKWIKAGITLVSIHLLTATVTAYEKLDASKFTLKGYPNRYDDLIAKLDDALPNISVATVIANTNHPMKSYSGPSNFVKDFT